MSNKPTQIPNNELDIKYLAEPQKPTLADYYDVADKSKDGGMGEIFFCQDKRTKEFCVLKTFKTEKEDYENYFKQEAEFALSLEKHPNIVYTKTIVIEEGQNYMVMEFVGKEPKDIKDDVREKSRTLVNEINKIKEISKEQVLKWALDFCEGMLYLISIGMKAHKDIKPSNLFITKDKTLKIGDFGITAIENKGGSPGYRAPEYFDNKAKLDIRSDIYAFGIVLHQIINGYNILNQTKLRTVNTTVMEEDENPVFPNPEEIESKYFIDIIRKCLQIDPNKRYQTIEELKADLLTEAKKINLVYKEPKLLEMIADDWYYKGVGYYNIEQYELGENAFQEAIYIEPDNSYFHEALGDCLLANDKIPEAYDEYKEAEKIDSFNCKKDIEYNRAENIDIRSKIKKLEEREDYDEENEIFDGGFSFRKYQEDVGILIPEYLIENSKIYAQEQLYTVIDKYTNEFFDIIYDINPTSKYPNEIRYIHDYYERGNHKFIKEDYHSALYDYTRVIAYKGSEEVYYNRGCAYYKIGAYKEAAEDFSKVIEINDKNANAYYNRGNARYYMKKHIQAISDYDEAINLKSNVVAFYVNRGVVRFELGQFADAMKDYKTAQDFLGKEDSSLYSNFKILKSSWSKEKINEGDNNVRFGNYKEAIKDYSMAIELWENTDIYIKRGRCYEHLGKYEEAIKDYTEAILFDYENRGYYYFIRGNVYEKIGKYEEAIKDYTEAVKRDPEKAFTYLNRGIAEYYLKQYTQAIADMQKYIELTSDPQKKKEAQEFIEKIKKEQGLS